MAMPLAYLCLSFLSLQNRPFPFSPKYSLTDSMTPSLLPYFLYHKDGISGLGTDRSQNEPYQENMGGEEIFQIHIQSQQTWQLVTCVQGHCPARAEHRKSVNLAPFSRFPGVAASICLHYMHRLSCYLAQENQS